MKSRRKSRSGFTLLEVMIAVTIMTIAFAAILSSQSSSIILTMKTKELNIASWLANNAMVESEYLYDGKPFSELPKEQAGTFPAPFERFSYKREIKEVKFPDFSANADDKEGKDQVPETMRLLTKVITKFLNDSIREMIVTVSWERGKATYKVTVSTYLIDLKSEFNFSI